MSDTYTRHTSFESVHAAQDDWRENGTETPVSGDLFANDWNRFEEELGDAQ